MSKVNAVLWNVAVQFKSSICPRTGWQEVNICISGTIRNFPTKPCPYYIHGNLPKDTGCFKQTEIPGISVLEG